MLIVVDHYYFNIGTVAGGAQFEVELRGSPARVFLIDVDEYASYCDGDAYEWYGDFFDVSPIVLEVPYDDHWVLVIDSNEGHAKFSYRQIFDNLPPASAGLLGFDVQRGPRWCGAGPAGLLKSITT